MDVGLIADEAVDIQWYNVWIFMIVDIEIS